MGFFTSKMTNGGYFQWNSAVNSKKDIVKQGIKTIQNALKTINCISHTLPFLLYNNSLKLLILLNNVNFYL